MTALADSVLDVVTPCRRSARRFACSDDIVASNVLVNRSDLGLQRGYTTNLKSSSRYIYFISRRRLNSYTNHGQRRAKQQHSLYTPDVTCAYQHLSPNLHFPVAKNSRHRPGFGFFVVSAMVVDEKNEMKALQNDRLFIRRGPRVY